MMVRTRVWTAVLVAQVVVLVSVVAQWGEAQTTQSQPSAQTAVSEARPSQGDGADTASGAAVQLSVVRVSVDNQIGAVTVDHFR